MSTSDLTAGALNRAFASGELSAVEIVDAFLTRIEQAEPTLGAFLTVTADQARERARKLDSWRKGAADSMGPMAGVPVAIKDNMCTLGVRTTCASKILHNFVPEFDATAVSRLVGSGAIVIGKANLDEFAMGSSTENSGFQVTRNPWDRERVPGGSSGGSAVAVAASLAPVALGSDTGGSIRQPASFSGVTGLKPTYGRVSRYGLIAFASSLDQIGPFAHDVADVARVLGVMAGRDRRDSTSADVPVPDYLAGLAGDGSLKGLRLGVPAEYFAPGTDPGVKAVLDAAIAQLQDLGATVDECSLPHTEYALSAYYIIAPAEASSNLARFDGVRYGLRAGGYRNLLEMYGKTRDEGFGPEVKRRIMLGTYALSAGYYDAYYLKALKVRTLVKRDFDAAFERFDALVTPTSPIPPFKLGERLDDPLTMYQADVCTIPVNLAGLPGLVVPAGFSEGLPVGMQLIAKPFAEDTLFKIGHAFQRATTHHKARPVL